MEREDFDDLKVRRVADLEERTAGAPISRRTFFKKVAKVGGAAAIVGVAGWLGLKVLAPELVPGPAREKYLTLARAKAKFRINGDKNPPEMISDYYEEGDTAYIRDTFVIGNRLTVGDQYQWAVGLASVFDGQNCKEGHNCDIRFNSDISAFKKGDIVAITALIIDISKYNGYDWQGISIDELNSAGKNTIKKA
ncbi:MAG TPA: hypothetical protein HA224_01205 [Nanoarchaeota archaeon]|nr:hypothetical protein [Nanoarchaeota archaeon]